MNEVQNVRITGSATTTVLEQQSLMCYASSGSFALSFNGATSADIAFDATLSQVQAALELMSTISTVTVTATDVSEVQTITIRSYMSSKDENSFFAKVGFDVAADQR